MTGVAVVLRPVRTRPRHDRRLVGEGEPRRRPPPVTRLVDGRHLHGVLPHRRDRSGQRGVPGELPRRRQRTPRATIDPVPHPNHLIGGVVGVDLDTGELLPRDRGARCGADDRHRLVRPVHAERVRERLLRHVHVPETAGGVVDGVGAGVGLDVLRGAGEVASRLDVVGMLVPHQHQLRAVLLEQLAVLVVLRRRTERHVHRLVRQHHQLLVGLLAQVQLQVPTHPLQLLLEGCLTVVLQHQEVPGHRSRRSTTPARHACGSCRCGTHSRCRHRSSTRGCRPPARPAASSHRSPPCSTRTLHPWRCRSGRR